MEWPMNKRNKYRAGFFMIELITAMFIMGLLLAALAVSLSGYGSFNDYLLTRQRCTAAAEAQLDSIAATGTLISDDNLHRLWPTVQLWVEKSDGRGQWYGLKLVTVTAEAKSRRKTVRLQLSRYILSGQER
jgi:type II secretory pathway pseudopilin PulG